MKFNFAYPIAQWETKFLIGHNSRTNGARRLKICQSAQVVLQWETKILTAHNSKTIGSRWLKICQIAQVGLLHNL